MSDVPMIDVLSVMDDLHRGCRAYADSEGRAKRTNYADDLLERRSPEARAELAELIKLRDDICAIFQIGSAARTPGAIIANVSNARRRSSCLSAIENEFFTREVPDEESDGETVEWCNLSWGSEPSEYVEKFRIELARITGETP